MAYNKKTWTTEELATSTGLNQMSDNIGHAIRTIAADANLILARVEKSISLDGTTTSFQTTVTFATDCVDGDPGFDDPPTVIGCTIKSDGALTGISGIVLRWGDRTATEIKVKGEYQGFSNPSGFTAELHMALVGV